MHLAHIDTLTDISDNVSYFRTVVSWTKSNACKRIIHHIYNTTPHMGQRSQGRIAAPECVPLNNRPLINSSN